MLVLVSDLHITDETTANNVNPEAFELLGAEIVDAASRRGAREIHLVLLGDILDLVRSDYWHRSAVPMARRPWGGTLDPRTGMNADRATVEPQFQAVLRAVLATPTAGALRTMLASLTTGPIPLRATYVIGAPASLVDQLKEVNNLRPLLDVFAWLEWVGGASLQEHRQMLHEALRRALDGLLSTTLAHQWDRLKTDYLVSGDLVDRLEQARAVLLGPDFETFRGRIESLERLQRLVPALLPSEDGLLAGARAETVFQGEPVPGGVQRVIYGHTHRARHDYFSAAPDGMVRMYINTGTFLPLITRARDGRTFASAQQMTMVFAYREDEDTQGKRAGTTSIDIWNGTRRKLYG